ncbi:MAG: hypothetical protein U0935_02170 [Pirellulales bacterium]
MINSREESAHPESPDGAEDQFTPMPPEEVAGDETGSDDTPGLMSKAVYSTCYCLAYGVAWPTLFVLRALPAEGAVRRGLRDGVDGAAASSDRTREKLSATAGAVRRSAENAYTGVAQRVQERVEAVQDSLAERRYRRRLGGATA